MTMSQKDRAAAFHAAHAPGKIIALANVWDAASARVVEECGAEGLATSSAAVAWTHGYRDGEALSLKILLTAVAEIVRAIKVPLSVDMEQGYASDARGVEANVAAAIDAGAIGMNIEDGREPPDLLAQKIEAARRASNAAGVKFFINARTDVYLKKLVPEEAALKETLARAAKYQSAGCDGVFVPGVIDIATFQTIVKAVSLPVNAMARPGLPPVSELKAAGVRRVSAGTGAWRAAFGGLRSGALQMLKEGRYDAMNNVDASLFSANALFPEA